MIDHDFQGSDNRYSQTPQSEQPALKVTLPETMLVPLQLPVTAAEPTVWGRSISAFLAAAVDSEGTRRAYGRHLRNAGLLFGVEHVGELNGELLSQYRASVVSSGVSPASQAQALSALRSFLGWCGSMGGHRLSSDVVKVALRSPRSTVQVRYTVITEREVGAILRAASSARDRAILGVLLGAGLRVAEAAALHVSDIIEELDGGVALFVRQGKGRKDRIVPIGVEVDGLLRDYLVESSRYLGNDGPLFLASDRGVSTRADAGLSTRALSRLVKEMALAGGIAAKRVTPHSLRHTYAIRCLRAGGNVVAVAKLLGHSSIATTQRYVDHLAVSELRSTVPALPLDYLEKRAS